MTKELQLLDQNHYNWMPERFCRVTGYDGAITDLKFYRGVTKLLRFGEETFEQKLIRKMGYEAAQAKLKEVRKRGNKAHAKLETNLNSLISQEVIDSLGEHLGSEILVYGNLLGVNIIGFIDAVFRNPDGTISLIDYKTKKSKSSFKYYDPEGQLAGYYRQLVTYSALFKSLYGEPVSSVKVVLIYSDKPLENDVYTLERQSFLPYAKYMADKVKAVKASRS